MRGIVANCFVFSAVVYVVMRYINKIDLIVFPNSVRRPSMPKSSLTAQQISNNSARSGGTAYYRYSREEGQWVQENRVQDLDEIRGAGDGMEWKKVEQEQPLMLESTTTSNVASSRQPSGKNVSRVTVHASPPIDGGRQPTAPLRAKAGMQHAGMKQHVNNRYFYSAHSQ